MKKQTEVLVGYVNDVAGLIEQVATAGAVIDSAQITRHVHRIKKAVAEIKRLETSMTASKLEQIRTQYSISNNEVERVEIRGFIYPDMLLLEYPNGVQVVLKTAISVLNKLAVEKGYGDIMDVPQIFIV